MYAIVQSGSQQFKVAKGDVISVAKLDGKAGDQVMLDQVLLVADGEKITIGTPVVKGAKVQGQIMAQTKGDKIISFKYRRRKDSRRTRGSRQPYTELKVLAISA